MIRLLADRACGEQNLCYFSEAAVRFTLRRVGGEQAEVAPVRFYFHLRIGGSFSPDEIGLDLPDLETAYLQAFETARAMWGELLAEHSDPLIRAFEIADEHGQVLLTVPFREVLERARKPQRARPGDLKAALQERKMLVASLREQIETARKTAEATRDVLQRSRGE